MITGGLGALGILTAQWLAGLLRTNRVQSSVLANTAARASAPPDLYLISRTGRSDASALAIGTPLARLLAESAAMVTILRADVAESSEAALLWRLRLTRSDAGPSPRSCMPAACSG